MKKNGWKLDKWRFFMSIFYAFITYQIIPWFAWTLFQEWEFPLHSNTFLLIFAILFLIRLWNIINYPPRYQIVETK